MVLARTFFNSSFFCLLLGRATFPFKHSICHFVHSGIKFVSILRLYDVEVWLCATLKRISFLTFLILAQLFLFFFLQIVSLMANANFFYSCDLISFLQSCWTLFGHGSSKIMALWHCFQPLFPVLLLPPSKLHYLCFSVPNSTFSKISFWRPEIKHLQWDTRNIGQQNAV